MQACFPDQVKLTCDVAEGGMTLGIVKRSEDELATWLASEPGFVEGLLSYDDEPIALEEYQRSFLRNGSRFRWVTKSRQVGFSFLFALEALARCHLREKHTAVFVSYNLDDAKEKILIARQFERESRAPLWRALVPAFIHWALCAHDHWCRICTRAAPCLLVRPTRKNP